MNIYPSILEKTAKDYIKRINQYSPFFSHFQLDIVDNKFVEGETATIEEITNEILKPSFMNSYGRTQQVQNDNNRTDLSSKTFELHLMVDNYKLELKSIEELTQAIRITRILIHASTMKDYSEVKTIPFQWGLVFNPEDIVENYKKILIHTSVVQLMTIHPGKQGNEFLPETLEKIDQLRTLPFEGEIILDGAMNDKTLEKVLARKNLPDTICPGSYFHDNTKEKLEKLLQLLGTIPDRT